MKNSGKITSVLLIAAATMAANGLLRGNYMPKGLLVGMVQAQVIDSVSQPNSYSAADSTSQVKKQEKQKRVLQDKVKVISVYTLGGKLISGVVVSEDRNKITVAQVEGSKIVVNTYPTRQLELRSLSVANKLEYSYDIDLARYFASRTGDFEDDPDDFIQAIRYYERARYLLNRDAKNNKSKIDAIDATITRLKADRLVWIREVSSRAELKKLEFEATFEKKFDAMKEENKKKQDKLDKALEDLSKFKGDFYDFSDNINMQLGRISQAIAANENMIRDSWRRPPAFVPVEPRYYYTPPYVYGGSINNGSNYYNRFSQPRTSRQGTNRQSGQQSGQQPSKRTTRNK